MKKWSFILLLLLNILLLGGCWNYTEVNEHSNVAAIAIDKGENGKKYHITAELIRNKSDEGDTSPPSSLVEGDGNTILDTFRKMIAISAKKLYFGHCKVVVISQEVAEDGCAPILDFFLRDAEIRPSIDLVISKAKDAREILKQKPVIESIVGYELDLMLEVNADILFESKKREAFQVYNVLKTDGIYLTMPAIEVIETPNGDTTFKLSGVGVFKKDKFISFMDQEDTKSCLMATDQLKGGVLSVPLENSKDTYIAIEILKSKTKVTPVQQDGQLSMSIEIQPTLSIGQISCYDDASLESSYEIINPYVEERVSKAIKKVQQEYGVDILGFGSIIHQNQPKLWEQYKDNWDQTFINLPVTVKCSANIESSGLVSRSLKIGE